MEKSDNFKLHKTLLLCFTILTIGLSQYTLAQGPQGIPTSSSVCETCCANTTREYTRNPDVGIPTGSSKGRDIDDRTCAYNLQQRNGYAIYKIKANSNHWDPIVNGNQLQPRIERSTDVVSSNNNGAFIRLEGTVNIKRAGYKSSSISQSLVNNPTGTYIMQAKGKHDFATIGSPDPAICLLLVKPNFIGGTQASFDIYREQIKVRGGSGVDGRELVLLTTINANEDTKIIMENGFRANKQQYVDITIGNTIYSWTVPQSTDENGNIQTGNQAKIRWGAYRVQGGEADIWWKDMIQTSSTGSSSSSNWSNLSDGWYKIVPNSNQSKVLTVDTQNGNNLVQYTDVNANNQKFYVRREGDYYELKSGAFSGSPGKSIDLNGWNTGNGTNISVYTDSNTNNQRWKFADGSNNFISIRSKLNLNKSLAIYGNEVNTERASVILWNYYFQSNCLFKFVPTTAPSGSSSSPNTGTNSSGSNLLRNKPYVGNFNSDFFANNEYSWGPQHAVDGNGSSRWASASNGDQPDYIGWDLGANYNISQMKVKWEAARGIDFGFVYYNNGQWFYMNTITNNNAFENTANVNVNARYVGIYITRGATGHSSAYEIEAYGYQAKSASKKNNITAAIPVDGNFPKIALEDKGITVFPNPVNSDSFSIILKGMEKSEITITNMLGKVVYKTSTQKNNIKINNNSNFKTGIYIVTVTDANNNKFRSKLLVK